MKQEFDIIYLNLRSIYTPKFDAIFVIAISLNIPFYVGISYTLRFFFFFFSLCLVSDRSLVNMVQAVYFSGWYPFMYIRYAQKHFLLCFFSEHILSGFFFLDNCTVRHSLHAFGKAEYVDVERILSRVIIYRKQTT